jgi:hypothetical protein
MTRRAEIERLARFMGWEKNGPCIQAFQDEFYEFNRGTKAKPCWKPFDPFTSLEDAMAVAEKITTPERMNLSFNKTGSRMGARFRDIESPDKPDFTEGATPAEAITLAALAYLSATGGKRNAKPKRKERKCKKNVRMA